MQWRTTWRRLLTSAGLVLALSTLTMCNTSEWICECRVSFFGASFTYDVIITNQTKKDAEAICQQIERDSDGAVCELAGKFK